MAFNSVENYINSSDNLIELANYNFEYETDIETKDVLERYYTYNAMCDKARDRTYQNCVNFANALIKQGEINENKRWDNFDCDGSGAHVFQNRISMLSRNIFRTIWNWKDIPVSNFDDENYFIKINQRYGKCNVFGEMGPDTMNTVTSYSIIFVTPNFVEKNQYAKDEIKKGNNYSGWLEIELYKNPSICSEYIKFLQNRFDFINYIDMYHTIGNYCLVPAYFNPYRSSNTNDNWTKSLVMLRNKNINDGYSWNYKGKEIIWNSKNFNKYINYFFLWDYVHNENDNYIPDVLEYSDSGFLEKTAKFIKRRGIFMVAMLKIADKDSDLYKKLQSSVFDIDEIYSGYDDVFCEISNLDNVKNNNEIKKLLDEAQEEIDKIKLGNV